MLISSDGIRFENYPGNPILPEYGDTHINPVWSPEVGKYLSYGRYGAPDWPLRPPHLAHLNYKDGYWCCRRIAIITSDDAIHWSDPSQALPGIQADDYEQPLKEFNSVGVQRYEGQFIAFLSDFNILLEPPVQPKDGHYGADLEISLASSRDGLKWKRVANRQPIIGRNEEEKCMQGYVHMLVQGDELWIYYHSHPYWHGPTEGMDFDDLSRASRVRLRKLRRDGFVSWFGPNGYLQTTVFPAPEGRLHVNADFALGQIVAEMLDANGNRLGASDPLRGNWHNATLEFKNDQPWKTGDRIAIRFNVQRGHLYSYWFD